MITKQTTIYKCEHCRKWGQVKAAMEKHERHCPNNPNREPKAGELYGNRYNSWFLHASFCDDPSQHPFIPEEDGMIWDGQEWLPVPEYREGLYGEPEWPFVIVGYDDGRELSCHLQEERYDRIRALDITFGSMWATNERARRIEAFKPKMLPPPSADDVVR